MKGKDSKMKIKSLLLSLLVMGFACVHGLGQASEAQEEKEYPDPARFEEAIQAFEKQDELQPPPQNAILGLGSSSMRGWHEHIAEDLSPLTIIPRGFGGSNMNEALYFADRIAIPYQPRAILLYEGDNDVAQGISPVKIKDTFLAFVHKIHEALPQTRIYVLSIKPSVSRWHLWDAMKEANSLIEQECALDERLTFIDVASGMLDAEGQVRPDLLLGDNLHMNREGYIVWRDIVRPILLEKELQYETARIEEAGVLQE